MLPDNSLVAQANYEMENAHGQIYRAIGLHLRGGMVDPEQSSVYDQICAVRFLKKFQRPTEDGDKQRKRACIDKWLDTEVDGKGVRFDALPPKTKAHLYRAKALLDEWLSGFKLGSEIEFTPGESFESARGRTSVYHKLALREHWTCTYDAFDDFAKLVYHTTGLKRAAKRLMKPLTQTESIRLLGAHASAYDVFKERLLTDVVTLVHGSRLSTVPKNNETDRAINVEATGNMLLQRQVAQPLRSILASIGNDLEIGQDVHRARIRDKNQATIDFSEASDRIWLAIIERVFPSTVLRYLRRFRSDMVLVDDSYHLVYKLSSMGCGFTFEVMSLLFLAIARVLDPAATVYGDDVIIANEHAQSFMEICVSAGLKVNVSKSFVHSSMRESCGAYYHDAFGYVTSYDFHWCESWNDVTIAMNKMRKIVDEHPDKLNSEVCWRFERIRRELLSRAPAFARGPVADDISCGYLQERNNYHRAQKKCATSRKLHSDVRSLCDQYFERMCYPKSYAVCKVQTFKRPDYFSRFNTSYLNQGPRYLAALLAGRYAPVTNRTEGNFSEKLLIAHPTFGSVLYSEIKLFFEEEQRHAKRASG